jgi:predicted PurR-regulated permease PerM
MSGEPVTPLLSNPQRRIAGVAITALSLFGSIALFVAAFYALGQLLSFFSSVIWPLAVAGVLALILRPVVDRIELRFRTQRLPAVIFLYFVFVVFVAAALLLIIPPLIEQTFDFVAYVPTLWDRIVDYVQHSYPHWSATIEQQLQRFGLDSLPKAIATESKSLLTHALPSVVAAFAGLMAGIAFLTHVVIIPVYLFFFLLMRGEPTSHLGNHLPFLRPNIRDDVVFLASEFVNIVVSFFRGQLIIGLCMGVLYATGFTIIGLKFGLFIGLALGLLNVVPYLGTILGLASALPLAFFQQDGGWHLMWLVIIVKIVVQCIESWILTPKIMGDRTGLHPAAIIFAVFFWGTAFHGVLGMLLAVPLTAFFVTVWRLAKRKYFKVT